MSTATGKAQKFDKDEAQQIVQHPLQLVRKYIRAYIILEGVALTLLCVIGLFWVGLALDFGLFNLDFPLVKVYGVDWIFEFNEVDDSGISSLVCRIMVVVLVGVALAIYGFSTVVMRWLSDFNDQAIALVLEKRFPNQLGDRLITAVELSDPALATKYGFSKAMVEKTIMEAVELIQTLPVSLVFNWSRLVWLWVFVALSSVGMLLANLAIFTSATAAFSDKWMSPYAFTWKFYHTASIWAERNIFMQNTYWPRRAHLEITGFQASRKERPTDMRVAKDGSRPELRVRAFQWVVADRTTPTGWRPLLWNDLPKFLPQDVLAGVDIPKEFPYWKLELDELEPEILNALYKESEIPVTQWSGAFRELRQDPEVKRKVKNRGAEKRLDQWVDWKQWTVDKLSVQKVHLAARDRKVVGPAFGASTVGLLAVPSPQARTLAAQGAFPGRTDYTLDPAPLGRVFDELEKLVDEPSMGRTLRKLVVPKFVEVTFRGEASGSTDPRQKLDGNKYAVPLNHLKESPEFTFRARGENYFTPKKSISLIPAPTASAVYTDTSEPAYRYHRLFGVDQMALRGLKHIKRNEGKPTSGSGNEFRIAGGTRGQQELVLIDAVANVTEFKLGAHRAAGAEFSPPIKYTGVPGLDASAIQSVFNAILRVSVTPSGPGAFQIKLTGDLEEESRRLVIAQVVKGPGTAQIRGTGGDLAIHVIIDNTPIAWAGMRIVKLTPDKREPLKIPATQGLLVSRVDNRSRADEMKLKVNDILLTMNGVAVPGNPEKFAAMVRDKMTNPETTVEFTVLRDGKEEKTQSARIATDLVYSPRKLRDERPIPEPERPRGDSKYRGFDGAIQIHDDRFGFTLLMENIVDHHEFTVDFFDEDNIRGSRKFKIDVIEDKEPIVETLSLGYAGRNPKFRTIGDPNRKKPKGKDAEPDEAPNYAEYQNAYLITPDAKLPFQCKVADTFGLVRVGYRYKYEKIDFELVHIPGSKKLPILQVGAERHIYRASAVGSVFQFWPGNPATWQIGPSVMAYAADMIELDSRFARGYREGFVPSAGFNDELKNREEEMANIDVAKQRMSKGIGKPRTWEFDFKTQDPEGFDLRKHLPELKADSKPGSTIGQMHYLLKIAVEASDNNVEASDTFVHSFIDHVADAQGVKKAVPKTVTLNGQSQVNKNGDISFIVISENELLSQIALDEEDMKEKLEQAKEAVDASKLSLLEQQSKIQVEGADQDVVDSILVRMNTIRTSVKNAGDQLIAAQQRYEKILIEMGINNINKKRIEDIENKVVSKLDHIVNAPTQQLPNQGSLPRAQDSFFKALQLLEEEKEAKRPPNVVLHRQNMTKAHQDLQRLSDDIQLVLNAMGEVIVEAKLVALLASIERDQRERSRFFRLQWEKYQEELIEALLKEKDKKEPEKKDEKKDLKKTSMLQSSEMGGRLAARSPVDAEFRRDVRVEIARQIVRRRPFNL
ncbi:MAG: PDZ domain-containing protein [Planctomycetes bacterium]|nr:PDZ domain-containing protein [Planctomycetota bacterium]